MAEPRELYGRDFELVVEDIRITAPLDVSFEVQRNLKKRPNDATIRVFNLNEQHRSQLEQVGEVRVSLKAGYKSGMSQIFLGRLRDVQTERDGRDWVTVISGLDGGATHRKSRIQKSFSPGVNIGQVIGGIARDGLEGIGAGNIADRANLPESKRTLSQGFTASGHATDEMNRATEAAGLEWSIQDEKVQLLKKGQALRGTAVRLAAGTGLLDSPSIDEKGIITARALLIPDIFPGRRVKLESQAVSAIMRAEQCTYTGDSFGDEWTIELQGKEERSA